MDATAIQEGRPMGAAGHAATGHCALCSGGLCAGVPAEVCAGAAGAGVLGVVVARQLCHRFHHAFPHHWHELDAFQHHLPSWAHRGLRGNDARGAALRGGGFVEGRHGIYHQPLRHLLCRHPLLFHAGARRLRLRSSAGQQDGEALDSQADGCFGAIGVLHAHVALQSARHREGGLQSCHAPFQHVFAIREIPQFRLSVCFERHRVHDRDGALYV